MDEVLLGSLPESFDPPIAAAILGPDDDPVGFAYVRPDGDGALRMTVPLHPTSPMEGGSVRLAFTDGTRACPVIDFSIQTLPEADGELAAVVELLRAALGAQAQIYGATLEELEAASVSEMAPSLWPLAMAQVLVDGPDNDASLEAVADGALGGEALDWTNRILARTGLRESLEASFPPAGPVLGSGPGAPQRSVEGLLCRPEFVDTGELLDFCMERAAEIAASVTGLSREVAADIQSAFASLDANGLPLAGEVQAVFGAVFWVIYTEREQAASLLPSRFTAMEATAEPATLREDDESPGELTAQVTAASLGYDLQQQIIDGIQEAASLVETTGKFDFSTGTAIDDVAAQIGPRFEDRIRDLDIEELDIPAELFGPIPLTDDVWLDSRLVSGTAVEIVGDVTFEGRERGPATISVRTADGRFGGAQISDQVDVEVTALQIAITPTEVVLPADAVRTFDVSVTEAKYPDLVEIRDPESLQGSAALTIGEGGSHYVTYVAPAEPNYGAPDLLVVRSTAETGARGYSDEDRLATATIRFARVIITPESPCLELGGTLDFGAQVQGLDDQSVVWSADVGSIDSSTGMYTAPTTIPVGDVAVITAVSTVDSGIMGQVFVQIGGCTCNWDLSIEGGGLVSQPGDVAGFQILEGIGIFGISIGSDGRSAVVQTEGIAIGQTGTFDVVPSGDLGIQPGDLFYSAGEAGPAQLSLVENDGLVVSGTVTGTVTITPATGSPPETRQGSFFMRFYVESEGGVPGAGGIIAHSCTVQGS